MKRVFNIILSTSFVIALALSPAYAYLGEKSQSDDIKQELQRLKENAKSYTVEQKDSFINEVQDVYNKMGKNIKKLNSKTRKKLNKKYAKLKKNIESLKNASDDKKKKLQTEIVVRLAKLNAEIEQSLNQQ